MSFESLEMSNYLKIISDKIKKTHEEISGHYMIIYY